MTNVRRPRPFAVPEAPIATRCRASPRAACRELSTRAAANFDWVIVDTPPIGLLTDTHLLSAMVDSAVLVIDAGRTQYAIMQQAIESIGREKIVGVVLNRVEERALADASDYELL